MDWTSLLFLAFFQTATVPQGPEQPIAYSHKTHLSFGLKCKDCHENKDPGEFMGIPATAKCMACHQSIKKESPQIAKLAEFHEAKRTVPWKRVYLLPGFVFFSHKTHLEGGAECKTCHGEVAQRDRLFKEAGIAMGDCMDCHRRNKASNDCTVCHEARN